jgi:hypothetical protein
MQSIISLISLSTPHSHTTMQTHASSKISNRKDISNLLFVQFILPHPSILSSTYVFHHAKCKCILTSTRLRDHMLYPTGREHAGPTCKHPLFILRPTIMNHHLTHLICKEKDAVFASSTPIRTLKSIEHKRSIQAHSIVTVMKKPLSPKHRRNTKENCSYTRVNRRAKNSARLCNKNHTRNEADQTRPGREDRRVECEDVISVAASFDGC